ncbi:hypothetical protein [Reyranella sp.]|uniref:hypothetical protein n=1 Tax=Reyranella sp. TaxID=1929291 RepID=UPI003BAC78E9
MGDTLDIALTAPQERCLVALKAVLEGRLASLGPYESGLFNFYVRKLAHDALLSQSDLQALGILRARRGQFGRLWEIGPGVGQLSIMLALDGHQVVAVEHDARRAAALAATLEVLAGIDRPARDRISVVEGSFPEVLGPDESVERDAIVCLGCAFTAPEARYRAFEAALSRFAVGVIDFARLFVESTDRADWRQRAVAYASTYDADLSLVSAFHVPHVGKSGELFTIVPRKGQQAATRLFCTDPAVDPSPGTACIGSRAATARGDPCPPPVRS